MKEARESPQLQMEILHLILSHRKKAAYNFAMMLKFTLDFWNVRV